MKLSFTSSFLLLFLTTALVAQKPKFYATTDARKIVEGSYLQVKFILEDAEGSNFKAPKFEGFTVVSGPSSTSSTSIINGVVSREFGYAYGLQPKSLGNKTIPSASILVNGKTMKTQPIAIEVVKGSNKSISADKQVFVRTELTDTSTYVGQQIILTYRLYTTVDIRSINFNTNPSFDGFFTEELRTSRQNYKREIIDGVEYFTKPISKVALFPQQTGTYKIEPANIAVGISAQGSRSIFAQVIRKNIISEGATIYVNNLPPPSPTFSGAVGRYRMQVESTKRSITTDEAITVNMEIIGNGDSKTVNPPRWDLPANLEMYDPNVIEDEVFPSADGLTHRKTFEYLIVAKEPGNYSLKPKFEYFNVDSNAYVTLEKNLGRIRVLQGSNKNTVVLDEKEVEMAGIFQTTKLKNLSTSSSSSLLPLLLLLGSFLGGLGIFFYGNHLEKSGRFDPVLIRKNKAYSVALQKLENSKKLKEQGEPKAFYEEIIRALKSYLTDKYNIPALHINRSELVSKLNDHDISEINLSNFDSILQKSEIAMYAPGQTSDLESVYQSALDLIVELEK